MMLDAISVLYKIVTTLLSELYYIVLACSVALIGGSVMLSLLCCLVLLQNYVNKGL